MTADKIFSNPGRHLSYRAPDPFVTIDDIEVEPVLTEEFGVHMIWRSASRGVIATFPWWDNVDRDERLADPEWMPVGTETQPHVDAEQDWAFKSWRDDRWVYVEEGVDAGSWERRYRVPLDIFRVAWRRGVDGIKRRTGHSASRDIQRR